MLFNSVQFAIFFSIVTLAYFLTPHRFRWATLLAASCAFYMAFIPIYIAILAGTIVIDYIAGIVIERATGRTRRAALVASLVANIGVLAVFKYFNFFAGTIVTAAGAAGITVSLPLLSIALPIGLSFHTFQAMAYTIEVYRGHQRAERHFGVYALYVMFYPQLVAGPIERPQNLLPQLRQRHRFDADRVARGLKLMAWGLFKKVVIADRLAATVNVAYAHPTTVNGPAMLLATVFFAWQIYCDFSGYSDMAIGAAEVMGITLMVNFRRPYLARTTREFWTRWHISLSTWFRDYVYIPMGGSRSSRGRWVLVVMATFLLSGLWHGANVTFVVWGCLNGCFLVVGALTVAWRARVRQALGLDRWPGVERVIQTSITFGLISISWVFFRANTVADALHIIGHLFDGRGSSLRELGVTGGQLALSIAVLLALPVLEALQAADDPRAAIADRPAWLRWTVYYAVILLTISIGVFNQSRFIYFQF